LSRWMERGQLRAFAVQYRLGHPILSGRSAILRLQRAKAQ